MAQSDLLHRLRERVDFVLINVPPFDAAGRRIRALDMRLAELTACFTLKTFGLSLAEVSFAPSHDAALAQGTKPFCLIQKFGHIFDGGVNVAAALLDATENCEFLMGHIMERGGYYYLHDQCTLVNRHAWKRLGRPAYGTPDSGSKRVAVALRSREDVHDDYTPVALAPTGVATEQDAAYGYGWNAISESLRNGVGVVNWSGDVRRFKRFCYAYYGDASEWQGALSDVEAAPATTDGGLRMILDFLTHTAAPGDARVPVLSAALDVPALRFRDGADCVFAPAPGFDANQILAAVGFNEATRIVWYDRNPAALMFKRAMIAAWDGDNLEQFLVRARDENAAFARDCDQRADLSEAAFRTALGFAFSSKNAWREHWQKFNTLRHEFLTVDPLDDPEAMAGAIRTYSGKYSVLSVGDIFDRFENICRFDFRRRKTAYDASVAAIKAAARAYLVVGTPPRERVRS